ncbi:MAG: TolC family protein, partial [Burkholderiales bacterium]
MKLHDMKLVALAALLIMTAACTVGPDYVRPTVEAPVAFKEMVGWKPAQPRDQEFKGKWWEAYNDPLLNNLEEQVNISNQNLAQAEAQYRQARALVQSARAGYFPTVSASASESRSRASSSFSSTQLQSTNPVTRGITNNYLLTLEAVWEPDLWGRVRRTVESNEASAQASAADLEAVRLSAQAELAQ